MSDIKVSAGSAGLDKDLLSSVGSVLAGLFKSYNDHFHQFIAILPSQVRCLKAVAAKKGIVAKTISATFATTI